MEILASRLQSQAITEFMMQHTLLRPELVPFDLPLHLGFGRPFYGFEGAEYDPNTEEIQYLHVVGHSEQSAEPQLRGYSIPVCPTNSGLSDVRRQMWDWLRDTLTSTQSMNDWLFVCFRGDDVVWIRDLLRLAWQYSIQAWEEQRASSYQLDGRNLDENLMYAWMMALVATMMSLPITIPAHARQGVLSNLQPLRPGYPYTRSSWSSRPINKCVKSLLFDIYQQLVEKHFSALNTFKRTRLTDITERHLGHVNCMAILTAVVSCQLQTSLMDNYKLSAAREDLALWEETVRHTRQVETALKNTVLYVRHMNKRWLRRARANSRDESAVNVRIQGLFEGIAVIKSEYSEAISLHRTVRLDSVMDISRSFQTLNMQRVFAFYFDPTAAEGRPREGRRRAGR